MIPESRPYQTEGVAAVIGAMRRGVRSVVRVLPTGGGKTVEAGLLAKAVKKGMRILFLVHRRELVKQAWEVLSETLVGEDVGVEAARWPATPWARVRVAGIQSLVRRLAHIPAPDVVFIDEGHHVRARTWETVLRAWPNARLILLTATPERLDGLGLGMWAEEMILGPSAGALIADGYLARTRVLQISMAAALEWRGSNTIGHPVSAYLRHVPGSSAIYFGKSVANSREVCDAFRAAGVAAEHVDGEDSDARRDAMMRAFKAHEIAVLGNCRLFSEGLDVPTCRAVIVGRYTTSVTDWLQMCGRCARPEPPGKDAVVIDLGGASHDLGLPTDERTWSLEDGEVHQRKRAVPVRGRTEAPGTVPVHMVETELVEATPGAKPPEPPPPPPDPAPKRPPVKRGELRKRIEEVKAHAKRSDAPDGAYAEGLRALAVELGYKPGWVGADDGDLQALRGCPAGDESAGRHNRGEKMMQGEDSTAAAKVKVMEAMEAHLAASLALRVAARAVVPAKARYDAALAERGRHYDAVSKAQERYRTAVAACTDIAAGRAPDSAE